MQFPSVERLQLFPAHTRLPPTSLASYTLTATTRMFSGIAVSSRNLLNQFRSTAITKFKNPVEKWLYDLITAKIVEQKYIFKKSQNDKI
ncbi:hypothetical protein AB833_17580 [Chromatiales bacterium (ex Bugula neritina AB1)]|nr:hypothetical protein AB833_17580 [Chromatiales bacterium (ex Bugula neritina AB1)]